MFIVKIKRLSKQQKTFRLSRKLKKKLQRGLDLDLQFFWNTLKIKADPTIDINFTKGMSALSLYSHNFQTSVSENISESSVYFRPDVIFKLSNLNISDKDEEECKASVSQQDKEISISQEISCLRISDINLKSLYDKLWNLNLSENVKTVKQL